MKNFMEYLKSVYEMSEEKIIERLHSMVENDIRYNKARGWEEKEKDLKRFIELRAQELSSKKDFEERKEDLQKLVESRAQQLSTDIVSGLNRELCKVKEMRRKYHLEMCRLEMKLRQAENVMKTQKEFIDRVSHSGTITGRSKHQYPVMKEVERNSSQCEDRTNRQYVETEVVPNPWIKAPVVSNIDQAVFEQEYQGDWKAEIRHEHQEAIVNGERKTLVNLRDELLQKALADNQRLFVEEFANFNGCSQTKITP